MERGTELFRKYIDGDEKALEEFILLYKDNLIFFINRYTKNLSDAEELAEDSFVSLILHKHSYNFGTPIKTYLFTIGRNKALNLIKHCNRHKESDLSDFEYSLSDNELIEDKIIKTELQRAVNKAISNIKEDYAAILHLIYFDGLNADDAAHIMKKNKKQVENLIFRGREALKKELLKEGISYED